MAVGSAVAQQPATSRAVAWVAGVGFALCVLAQALAALLMHPTAHGWDPAMLLFIGYPAVGALIVSRQSRNVIGWLLFGTGLSITLGLTLGAVVYRTLDPQPARWQAVLAWVANLAFIGGFEFLLVAMAFLYPTGHPLTRRWRWAFVAAALVIVADLFFTGLRPGKVGGYFDDLDQLTNPFGVAWVGTFIDAVGVLLVLVGFALVVACLSAVVTRVRRARGIERLQLQWLALALGGFGVLLLISVLTGMVGGPLADWISGFTESIYFFAATLGVAAAIGIAILRYRLYDIERLVNRAIVYVSLSTCLAAGYAAMVVVLQALLNPVTHGSDLIVAGATLAVAALFRPLHGRIQRAVDRRFYRRRYDAERTIAAFSALLRDEIDLDNLVDDLHDVVQRTMQPSSVSVWVRPSG